MKTQSAFPKSVQPGIPSLPSTPKGWKRAPLGMFLAEVRRPIKLEDDKEYDLVTVKRARGGVERRERLLGKQVLVKSQFLIVAGDFLISKRQIVHGACGLVPDSLEGSIVSNEYAAFHSKGNIDLLFVRYLSETVYFQQTCFHSSIGVHVEKMLFKVNRWLRWEFNFPPLHEQRRIGKILSTWDRAIETTEKLIANSKAQKKILMQQLLTGDKRFPAYKEKWKPITLKDCVVCLDSKRVPLNSTQREKMKGDIPYWGANGIVDYINDYLFDEPIVLLAEDGGYFDEFSDRPIANISYGKSWVNNHAHVLKAKSNATNEWIYYSLTHKNILAYINGGTRAKLNKNDMLTIPIDLPSFDEQIHICTFLDAIHTEINRLSDQLDSLRLERKALIQELLSGKRRVKLDSAA